MLLQYKFTFLTQKALTLFSPCRIDNKNQNQVAGGNALQKSVALKE